MGNDLVVNTILGTFWPSTTYSGVHLVRGGVVQVRYSEGVSWSITQVIKTNNPPEHCPEAPEALQCAHRQPRNISDQGV